MGSFQAGLSAAPVTSTTTIAIGGTQATVDWTGATANFPRRLSKLSWFPAAFDGHDRHELGSLAVPVGDAVPAV